MVRRRLRVYPDSDCVAHCVRACRAGALDQGGLQANARGKMTKLFGAAIALAAVVAAFAMWWWGDSSYEECLLTRMKGQS